MTITVANQITIARILLVPFFVVELLTYVTSAREIHRYLAVLIFTLAAVGDGVDGFVARRFHQRSELGSLLDPLADKLLLVLALVILSLDLGPHLDKIPLWLTATVLGRDVILLLLGVLTHYLAGNRIAHPHFTGKCATVLLMICVLWALLKWDPKWLGIWAVASALFTAISGLIYIRDGIRRIRVKTSE